jgi:hypothetical protein
MAEQPKTRNALNLVGAVVADTAGAVLVVIAVLLAVTWTSRGMVPWGDGGFLFWWVSPVLALIGVAMFAVGTSFSRQWRRSRAS